MSEPTWRQQESESYDAAAQAFDAELLGDETLDGEAEEAAKAYVAGELDNERLAG